MDRRDFIKVSTAAGASATLAGCGHPEAQLIRFIPEEPLYPGIAMWKPSICSLCSAGCGLQVRVMEGEAEVVRNGQTGILRMGLAKKLEGSAQHPISQGRLCVRGQAAIQVTYHPDRIRHPLKRTGPRGNGPFQEITWDEALAEFVSRLNQISDAGEQKSLCFLTRPLTGQRAVLVSEFLRKFGAPPAMTFEVFTDDVLREANRRSFGHAQLPTFDLARSRYVLSFGADFLGTWNSPVSHSVAYGEMRQGRPGVRAKFVQIEPRMSQTGANADEWVPVKPGTEGILARGLAHVIRRDKSKGTPPDAYTPQEVEKQTGVSAARIERLAKEFAEHGPAIAIVGGAPLAQTNGMSQAMAVNELNLLAGTVGQPGGIVFTPRPQMGVSDKPTGPSLREAATNAKMLLIHDTNPVFGGPPSWGLAATLNRIPYIVSFGNFLDETSMLADLILPDHSFLESWVDGVPESGTRLAVASLAPPVMRPLHQTRSMPDVLLDAGQRLTRPLSLPWISYEEMLKAAFASVSSGTNSWEEIQEQGGWWSEAPVRPPQNSARPEIRWADAQFDGAPSQYPFHFLPYPSQAFFDGSLAHLPWLQELPDAVTTVMWSSWVEVNPKTAESLGLRQGDLVEVTSSQGTIQAPAVLSPGIAPDVVAMPVGQGHQTFTRYASGRGANPLSILAGLTESETGALAWAATRVRIAKVDTKDRKNALILFSSGITEEEERHR